MIYYALIYKAYIIISLLIYFGKFMDYITHIDMLVRLIRIEEHENAVCASILVT